MSQVMQQLVNAESVGMSSARLDRIGPALQPYVDDFGYPGFTTLVSRRGQLVHHDRVGFQDREAGTPLAADTIYRLYSMTKPVICTALMLLFEEGRFQLVDPVAKYIPAFGATKIAGPGGTLEDQSPIRPMQVRDVMNHTAGLTYDFLEDTSPTALYREHRIVADSSRTLEAMIEELATLPLAFAPGTRWNYSVGTDVTARLIEVISGQKLGDFLQERLFGPLGMTDTGFGVPESERGRVSAMYGLPDLVGGATMSEVAAAYMAGDNGRRDVDGTYPVDTPDVFQRGGHGLFSTGSDYMRFAQMLLTGRTPDGERIIGEKTLGLMHTNTLAPELLPYQLGGVPSPGYGFGLGSRVAMDVGQIGLATSVGEFGWAGAAKTYFWVDPAEELVGVIMTQFMVGFELPEATFRAVVYSAIED
jgi:CubicO group peptidase (beta-lactamase class C family)